jgi:hypothetical protein
MDAGAWAARIATAAVMSIAVGLPAATAAELEGVTIAEKARLGKSGPELVLNGAGVRHKMVFIKTYVGALYLTAKSANAGDIIKDPGAKRVLMHVIAGEITAKEWIASLNNSLAANHIPAELALIESRLRDLNAMMNAVGALKKGAVVLLDYIPGRGTRITVNGREQITIKGEDFFQALLRIWIGDKPVDGRLRDAMLGGTGEFRLF